MKQYEALIFEGGGVKGIAYTGALQKLEELGVLEKIKYVSGTSAGSQAALLVACGYSAEEIEKHIMDAPFTKFLDSSWGFIRDIYRLIFKYGFYKGEYLEKYIDNLVFKKIGIKNINFENLYNKTGIELRITGTCLTTNKLEWFDYKLTPKMSVSKAVLISSSIPFIFKPVIHENKLYVDGGCLNNMPTNAFDGKSTLALNLEDCYESLDIKNFKQFSESLINTVLKKANYKEKIINVDTIDINTGKISAVNFNLSKEDKLNLKENGYKAVTDFLST